MTRRVALPVVSLLMAPSSLDATIVPGQPPAVVVQEQVLATVPGTAAIPLFSVNAYELPVKSVLSPRSER